MTSAVAIEPESTGTDAGWIDAVYRLHWVGLVRLATLVLSGTGVAEDIVQEVLVNAYRLRGRFGEDGPPLSYLRTAVVNRCRSEHRHRVVVLRAARPPEPPAAGPEDEVGARQERDAVMRALADLPQRQREVLVLRYYSDLSEADIAQTLGISRGSVKSHAHRGIAALRTVMDMDEEGSR